MSFPTSIYCYALKCFTKPLSKLTSILSINIHFYHWSKLGYCALVTPWMVWIRWGFWRSVRVHHDHSPRAIALKWSRVCYPWWTCFSSDSWHSYRYQFLVCSSFIIRMEVFLKKKRKEKRSKAKAKANLLISRSPYRWCAFTDK